MMNVASFEKGKPTGQLVLNRELINYLLSALESFETLDFSNRYSQLAGKLKNKIMRYAKVYREEDRAAIFLYGKEAETLIMLLTVYISSFAEEPQDRYSEIGITMKRNE